MTPRTLPIALALTLASAPAWAGIEGVRLEGGPVFLTRPGALPFGTSAIESDAGWALRGRLRIGLGAFSLAGEIQGSSQGFGAPAPGGPENLNATFVGLTAGFHPVTLLRVTPYAEIGRGRLTFSDAAVEDDGGFDATTYGLGALIRLSDRVGLDASLRLLRQGGLHVSGVAADFKYDPKLFSVMLSLKL
jgi:Outer membrane protein beta-barrel domain